MARTKTRTAADIIWDITMKAMESSDPEYIKFTAPNADGAHVVEGTDWMLTVHADMSHTISGTIPAYIAAFL